MNISYVILDTGSHLWRRGYADREYEKNMGKIHVNFNLHEMCNILTV